MTPRRLSTSILLLLMCLAPLSVLAQSRDAVLVLSHGGVQSLDLLDLQPGVNQSFDVIQGSVRLYPQNEAPQTIEDLRVLPDGQLLTSGIRKNQLTQFDPLNTSHTTLYTHNTRSQLKSLSVITYSAFGTPRRILFTDNSNSIVNIFDTQTEKIVWRQSLFITGGVTSFAQAILLPNAKLAIATNWSALDLHAIDIVELAPGPGPSLTRFSNTTNIDHPEQTFIREQIDELRDLVAIDAETLLVTTQFSVFAMRTNGDILWTINMADDLNFGGEFASARITLNNTIAIATFEPGVWVQPHPNHKIHWYRIDQNQPQRITQSGPLPKAPKRIEPAQSTGGTGTLNYRAGLQDIGQGDLEDINITMALTLSATMLDVGDALNANFIIKNASNQAVTLKRMAVLATAGNDCDAPGQPTIPILEETELIVEPDAELGLAGDIDINEESILKPGQWCLQAGIQDVEENWKVFAPRQVITVNNEQGNTKPKVPTRDLRVSTPDMPADLGTMDMTMEPSPPPSNPDDGCGCRQIPTHPTPPWFALLGILALFYRRMR